MREFNIGDRVWIPRYRQVYTEVQCPVCFGKKLVTVILGNGDEVILPCSNCEHGIGTDPSGTVMEYIVEQRAEPVTITGKEVHEDSDGKKVIYHSSGGYIYYSDKIFETQEEALAESVRLGEADKKDHEEKAEHIKKDKLKSFAWNAGYHLREAKKNRKDAEYHEHMAVLCKARSKAPVKEDEE
jgi:lipoate synthase